MPSETIETLEEWNQQMSCCCQMPICPIPSKICESITKTLNCGYYLPRFFDNTPEEEIQRFLTIKTTFVSATHSSHPSGFPDDTPPDTYDDYTKYTYTLTIKPVNDDCVETYASTSEFTTSEVYHSCTEWYTFDVEHKLPFVAIDSILTGLSESSSTVACHGSKTATATLREAYWLEDGSRAIRESEGSGVPHTSDYGCYASLMLPDDTWTKVGTTYTKETTIGDTTTTTTTTYYTPLDVILPMFDFEDEEDIDASCVASYHGASYTKVRYKWKIPEEHTGTFFKITWDTYEFPESDDVDPSSVELDKTWEWTGGSKDSRWFYLDPPETPGKVSIVNVRFECYRKTPWGNKPQITGEGYDPTA